MILCLTEGGTYPQLPTQPKKMCALFKLIHLIGHSELPREEKSKFEVEEKSTFEVEEKKFSLLLKMEIS